MNIRGSRVRQIIFACGAVLLSTARGATLKVPLKTGWKFVKADDPKYVCDASMSNEARKLSAILDRAERGDLSGGIDFDWAKPSFDDSSWKEVRVGVIGLGNRGSDAARRLSTVPGVRCHRLLVHRSCSDPS